MENEQFYHYHLYVNILLPLLTALQNLALHRPTYQSSLYGEGKPGRAVDGNADTNYDKKSCTHTQSVNGSWWMVDLGNEYNIHSVKITNRANCCG